MELKDFVSQSLLQVFEGVQQAQSQTKDTQGYIAPSHIRPSTKDVPNHQSVIGFSHYAPVVSIDFDVSVTTQDITKEKAGLGIFVAALTLGGQIGSETSSNELSRLKFSVPVILPLSPKLHQG